ncbi:MAG TPA: cupin-like domain-containing protein [Bryobacteraceae bacterium]|nr:cupin-like domain-containing protein [Bryobacteraceae bacterium]
MSAKQMRAVAPAETENAKRQTLSVFADNPADPGATLLQVDKREKLSRKEFLHEYVLKNRPVVLKDAARDWKALSKWTPEFFREHYGLKKVPVFERKRAVTLKDTVLLKDYVDEISSSTFNNKAKYLFSLRIQKDFPELLKDLEPRPALWDPNWLDSRYLLPGLPGFKLRNITGLEMNMGGTGSPFPFLHYDDLWTQTFITQVHGRKDWVLYPPDQTPFMYPSKEADNISSIPMETDVDLTRFPLFSQAKPVRVIIEHGEMLYGAPGWWHTTRALTPSIAVVLSTANGCIWSQVTRSAFQRAWRHPKWYYKPAAFPIAGYMTAFRAVKSLTDPF